MKIKFIINPVSGTGKQEGIEELIKKECKFIYNIVYTKKRGDAFNLSKKAVSDGLDIVIAVGGDGTVNECARAIINSETALGVIPCGSGNGFAYHIGMHKKIKKSIQQLKLCSFKKIDSCSVNDIPFVNVSGIGFDAHIGNLFAKKKSRGFINYVKLIIRELSYKSNNYVIKYNGEIRKVDAFLIAFANASQYGNNAHISPLANICDNQLDFVIIKNFPKWKIPLIFYMLTHKKIHLSRHVEIIQTNKMTIETKNSLVHLDGEPNKLKTPITIQLHPRSLTIFSPYEKS